MTRLPGALFVVDTKREHIAIKEAQKLKIPIFAMVDTNSDPREVDFVIPANDDATKSIDKITSWVVDAIAEGLQERKKEKDAQDQSATEGAADTETAEATETAAATEVVEEAPKVEEPQEESDDAQTEAPQDESDAEEKKEK